MEISIRKSTIDDLLAIRHLYQTVAKISGGIARKEWEVTEEYIAGFLHKSLDNGISLVAEKEGQMVAEVHTSSPNIDCLKHLFTDTTIAVHPDFQGIGLGKKIFSSLLSLIENERRDILRVELHARSSNRAAIAMYERIGFVQEGLAEGRVLEPNGEIIADVPMRWLNPKFGY